MTWRKTCEEIIEAGEKATARPWYALQDDANGVAQASTQEWVCHGCTEEEQEYITIAANNADRLARMVKTLTDKLRDGFDDGDRADGETLREMDKRLDRMWEQSK